MRHPAALIIAVLFACDVAPDAGGAPLPNPMDSGGLEHDCSPLEEYACGADGVCVAGEEIYACQDSGGLHQGDGCELDSDCSNGMACRYNPPPGVTGTSDVCTVLCDVISGDPCPGSCVDGIFDPASKDLGIGYCAA